MDDGQRSEVCCPNNSGNHSEKSGDFAFGATSLDQEAFHIGKTLIRLLCQTTVYRIGKFGVQTGAMLKEVHRRPRVMHQRRFADDFCRAPRMMSAQQTIGHDTKREDVDSMISVLSTNDFGSHMQWAPGSISRLIEFRFIWDRQTKIKELAGFHFIHDENVAWANVTVNETRFVNGVNGFCQLSNQRKRLWNLLVSVAAEDVVQSGRFDVLQQNCLLYTSPSPRD